MPDTVDLLQIKIEKAKRELPIETQNAIAVVDWKAVIFSLREKKGFSFEQLGDLEIETELLLCGLTNPADYPKELETRMKISPAEANELVNIMNERVFLKIRQELIKISERKKIFAQKNSPLEEYPEVLPQGEVDIHPGASDTPQEGNSDIKVLDSAGIKMTATTPMPLRTMDLRHEIPAENREEVLKKIENPNLIPPHPILAQKLSDSFKTKVVQTNHSLKNLEPHLAQNGAAPNSSKPPIDPYREIPE